MEIWIETIRSSSLRAVKVKKLPELWPGGYKRVKATVTIKKHVTVTGSLRT